ncbi:succinate dehydrogenase, cytochrome b556 subunit [Batrachochytrium salamandrivorans]|nr:succinate dehydrogenase, cytochrome b556 subunit [Batrachochytrium salamandrivorans]
MLSSRRAIISAARGAYVAPTANTLFVGNPPPSPICEANPPPQQQQRSISHYEKNEKLGRPVSPHVTIYAFPLAAITSVTHRVTGGLLTVGMYGIGIAALGGFDAASVMASIGQSSIGPLAKFAVSFPLVFHTFGGIRHLYWEIYPDGLHQDTQKQASIILVGTSSVVSIAAALM